MVLPAVQRHQPLIYGRAATGLQDLR